MVSGARVSSPSPSPSPLTPRPSPSPVARRADLAALLGASGSAAGRRTPASAHLRPSSAQLGPARPSARPGDNPPRLSPAAARHGVCLGVPRCASVCLGPLPRMGDWATAWPLLAARSAAASDLPPPLIARRPCLPRAGRRGAQGHRAGRGAGAQHPGAPPSRHAPASAPRLGTPPRHLASPPASPPFAPLCTPSVSFPHLLQARQNARRTQQQETARPTFSTRPTPPHPTPPPPHERQPQPQPRTPPRPLLPIPTRRSTTWRRSRRSRSGWSRTLATTTRPSERAPAGRGVAPAGFRTHGHR